MWSDEVRAENATAIFIDQRLVAVDGFSNTTCCIPIGYPRGLDAQFRGMRTGGAFGKAHGGDRRQCEGDAWHTPIVWLIAITFQDVSSGDFGIVARHWRQRRPFSRGVASRI